MLKRTMGIGALVLVAVLIIGAVGPWAVTRGAETTYGASGSSAYAAPATPVTEVYGGYQGDLSESEVEALLMALDDEYKAWSVYDQVIADLGKVRPFTNIRKAEENHIAALVTLFDRYELDVPLNEWPGHVPTFDTLAEACAAGVQAEIDNAALYDKLFSMVGKPDIIQVFTALQQASLTKHLPAFEECAGGEPSEEARLFLPLLIR